MWARVSRAQVPADKVDSVVGYFRDSTPPSLEGMTEAHLLVDRDQGSVVTITYWETEAAMKAAAEVAREIRAELVEPTVPDLSWQVDEYEVAA
jgi:heme-degrading monooxygenase HmoA